MDFHMGRMLVQACGFNDPHALTTIKIIQNKTYNTQELYYIIAHGQSKQTSQFVMMPLWTTKNSSPAPEDWGWLFLGAGTPCVAHLVWAIPACTLNAASKFTSFSSTSAKYMCQHDSWSKIQLLCYSSNTNDRNTKTAMVTLCSMKLHGNRK